MLKRIVILSVIALLWSSCVGDDIDNCETGLRLNFRYTHHNQANDQFSAQVGDIRIYVFDQATGLLADLIRVERKDMARGWMELPIPEGTYTLVAWAVSNEDMAHGCYLDAELIDPDTNTFKQVSVGVTTLKNFCLMLNTELVEPSTVGDVTPTYVDFDDLFFASEINVVVSGNTNRLVELDFTKDTSILNLHITGLEYLTTRGAATDSPLRVFVTGFNESYGYDNKVSMYAREVHYEPPYTALTPTTMDVDIKLLRLDIERCNMRPALLYIQNPTTGDNLIAPLNIMNAILEAKDAQGNLIWKTQQDIDQEDEFFFEVSISHDLSVSVTINEFEVVNTDPEIGRD